LKFKLYKLYIKNYFENLASEDGIKNFPKYRPPKYLLSKFKQNYYCKNVANCHKYLCFYSDNFVSLHENITDMG